LNRHLYLHAYWDLLYKVDVIYDTKSTWIHILIHRRCPCSSPWDRRTLASITCTPLHLISYVRIHSRDGGGSPSSSWVTSVLPFLLCCQASSSPIVFLFFSSSKAFFNRDLSISTSSFSPTLFAKLACSRVDFLPEVRLTVCCSARVFSGGGVGSRVRDGAASRSAAAEDRVMASRPAKPVQYDPETGTSQPSLMEGCMARTDRMTTCVSPSPTISIVE
jgi:hypothetical protein